MVGGRLLRLHKRHTSVIIAHSMLILTSWRSFCPSNARVHHQVLHLSPRISHSITTFPRSTKTCPSVRKASTTLVRFVLIFIRPEVNLPVPVSAAPLPTFQTTFLARGHRQRHHHHSLIPETRITFNFVRNTDLIKKYRSSCTPLSHVSRPADRPARHQGTLFASLIHTNKREARAFHRGLALFVCVLDNFVVGFQLNGTFDSVSSFQLF